MKKFLIVVGVIFAVSIVAFGISVAATGINVKEGFGIHFNGLELIRTEGENSMKKGETYSSAFTKEQSESVGKLKISTTSAETTISCDESIDEIRVNFTSNRPGTAFTADIVNDELVINESGFGFWVIFWWTGGENRLDVTLPKAEYEKMTLNSTSGTVKVDGLIFEDFNSTSTSGTSEYNIFADNIKAFTTSGRTTITNCTDRRAASLSFDTTSGSHNINGFTADKFHIGSTSGKIVANGISGKGDVSLTSGKIEINYSDWNDDLEINVTSGSCVVNLPEGSGADARVDALSGGMTIRNSDGTKASLSKADSVSFGGENRHKIYADLTSGSIKVNIGE